MGGGGGFPDDTRTRVVLLRAVHYVVLFHLSCLGQNLSRHELIEGRT